MLNTFEIDTFVHIQTVHEYKSNVKWFKHRFDFWIHVIDDINTMPNNNKKSQPAVIDLSSLTPLSLLREHFQEFYMWVASAEGLQQIHSGHAAPLSCPRGLYNSQRDVLSPWTMLSPLSTLPILHLTLPSSNPLRLIHSKREEREGRRGVRKNKSLN